ncbi:hypothetical protein GCM10009839_23200 [Catenulispora yoronensis]|uniref:WXG100 family type VII secretion target n=1 Tax=Catenulispora yoronensis TaxID=450799 RepID=A0ABP5FFY9_9ACTN
MTTTRSLPALGFDPAPGDVGGTRDLGRALGGMGTELGTILSSIDGADRGSWQGQTAIAFMDHLNSDLKPAVQKCHDSFTQASSLLYRWADQLDGFQAEADRLEHEAEGKKSAVASAKTTAYGPSGTPHPTPAPAGSPEAAQDVKNQKALSDAQDAMGDVLRRAHDLHDRYLAAARTIADQLHHAGQLAPDKPGLFDSIVDGIGDAFKGAWHWVEEHADAIKFIGDLLSDLSGILGILAIITAPFEPLGAIFAVAAIATSAAALLTHLVAKAAGADVSWMSIGVDALGVLPGVGMLGKTAKVADEATAVARAAKLSGTLGKAFEGGAEAAHDIVGLAKEGQTAWKTFGVFGKQVAVWGDKTVGVISHDGSFISRAQSVIETTYRSGQLVGTKGLNLIPKVAIEPMSALGRTIDAGIKIAPKIYFLPKGIHNDMEMQVGNPFHALFE